MAPKADRRETSQRAAEAVRHAAARTAVKASTLTGDPLPRKVYELAGAPVSDNAMGELQSA